MCEENLQPSSVSLRELVQSAGLVQGVQAGPQVQMIGIAQDDLGPYIGRQIPVIHAFDGAHRSHRHEDGGQNLPMVRGDAARAGGAGRVGGNLLKFEHPGVLYRTKIRIFLYFCTI